MSSNRPFPQGLNPGSFPFEPALLIGTVPFGSPFSKGERTKGSRAFCDTKSEVDAQHVLREAAHASMEACEAIPHVPGFKLPPSTDSEFEERCLQLLRKVLRGWEERTAENGGNGGGTGVTFRPITGGITNAMVEVNDETCRPSRVVVRRFGDDDEREVVDRQQEKQALPQIARQGFGAQLLATFANGRVESFLHGRTMEPAEMKEEPNRKDIAKLMRNFHRLKVDTDRGNQPATFSTIRQWLRDLEDLAEETDNLAMQQKMRRWKTELDGLERAVQDLGMDHPNNVVYCHHDLLAGNIMRMEDGNLQFIDFEYGSYGYRAFDIANHFNEYAGFECDYSRYPSQEERYNFYQEYLGPEDQMNIDKLERQVMLFRLVSHVFWGVWAKLQSTCSNIDFDFANYAELRWSAYFQLRDQTFRALGCDFQTGLSS